jgi:hypothetical protein
MPIESQTQFVQTNTGTDQRNAARDYFEYNGYGSVEFAMATWTTEKLNVTAAENPRLFKHRFGFEASTPIRSEVIAFQSSYDLQDSDIKLLKRSGCMQIRRNSMKIDKSLFMPVVGWLQICLFSCLVSLMLLIVGTSSAPEWKQGLGFSVLGLFAAVFTALIVKTYIMPRKILKDCGALAEKSTQKCQTVKAKEASSKSGLSVHAASPLNSV